MSTYFVWPPDDPKHVFPTNFWKDPLDQYQTEIEEEKCPQCGFTVKFISDKDQYEIWNDHSHQLIVSILEDQRRAGDCPAHPRPNRLA